MQTINNDVSLVACTNDVYSFFGEIKTGAYHTMDGSGGLECGPFPSQQQKVLNHSSI